MNQETTYLNEELKGRMLRHVSALWGVRNTDALDPLVRLLIEAIAGELEKTHHEVENFEKRVLEKISVLLTPGILSSHYPAHAVAHAMPVDSTLLLKTKTHFFHSKKLGGDKEPATDLFFTPVVDTKLFNGKIQFVVSGNRAFAVDGQLQKSILMTGQGNSSHHQSIWLGLQLDPAVKNIKDLLFYIDFKNTGFKKQLLTTLQSGKWTVAGQHININKGDLYDEALRRAQLFADFDTMHLLEKEIAHLYEDQFVKVDNDFEIVPEMFSHFPDEFRNIFSNSDLSKFNSKLLWVKISTTSLIEERILLDLFITINAFPVINRRMNRNQYRIKSITNIIPIKTDNYNYFVSVDSLKDSLNKEFKQIPYSHIENELSGTYSVRKSGTERIDMRGSKEYIKYLVDLVRDETVAFSSYGQDAITALVKDLDKILAQLEQRVKQSKFVHSDSNYYVTIEAPGKNEAYFMDYWTTNSVHANGVHTGGKLQVYEGSEIKTGSSFFLSSTIGGKTALESSRHMDAYKYAVLTHNKIITVEDIKAFFYFELGDKIDNVVVRKGLLNSPNPKEGLVRCIEIILTKSKIEQSWTHAEWIAVLDRLKSKMELRSSLNMSFSILLDGMEP